MSSATPSMEQSSAGTPVKTALVTGAEGFIGKHLIEALGRTPGFRVIACGRAAQPAELAAGLQAADVVFHLAGANRPADPAEFDVVNAGLTRAICATLKEIGRKPLLVFSSSIQAEMSNPYGLSKREAEKVLGQWAQDTGGSAVIFRLKNVFGKWCRPNYNSVTATFCHNVARGLPIEISDPERELDLVYVDDVVAHLLASASRPCQPGVVFAEVAPSHRVTLGTLAELIRAFRDSRRTLALPSFSDEFVRRLYATYLSHLEKHDFAYSLDQKSDPRGTLAEFIKQPHFGQLFVSRTLPGITRGNHYHHTKTEKFVVLSGEAAIRFRPILGGDVIEHRVSGQEFKVVDIPPGYAHSIENVGRTELVTLFWASEVFDPQKPDVYAQSVL
jgi:UDP-2-acetamido-2,6-beta-L-arabino-hexul-4-ose reductase